MSIAATVLILLVAFTARQRDDARAEAEHHRQRADSLDNAALILGEPWSIMTGVGRITRDLSDGTASGWVGWMYDQDPLAPCLDGPGYVVCCVAVKDVCLERP